jgi:nucleotide-binding universal stress UspA family protein
MARIGKIMAAIDGSDLSERVLDKASELAAARGASLLVVQVIEPVIYTEVNEKLFRELEYPSQEEYLNKDFEKIAEVVTKSGVTFERVVAEGVPAEEICNQAEEHGVDLVVIGRHGAGMLERFLLGSVSDRVVHHAPCSVYVVHA